MALHLHLSFFQHLESLSVSRKQQFYAGIGIERIETAFFAVSQHFSHLVITRYDNESLSPRIIIYIIR